MPAFYFPFLAFFLGIVFASVYSSGVYDGMFLVLLALLAGIFSYLQKEKKIALLSLVLVSFGLGMARLNMENVHDTSLDAFAGKAVTLQGTIVDEPDMRRDSMRLILKLDNNPKKILVTVDRLGGFRYGDQVRISGKLKYPENFNGQNGHLFDYASYLAKDDVYYEMYYPKISRTGVHKGNFLKEKLFDAKEKFLIAIGLGVPEPESSLLAGILLGAKHSLGPDLISDFQKVGLVHIVVLSGYNVSLVANWVMKSFSFLPRLAALGTGAFAVLGFVVMTGAGATGVRAGLMAMIVLFAAYRGREADGIRLLVFVAFLMVLWNPNILLHDPSFQLSFLATFGLFALAPLFSKRLSFVTERWQLREIVASTLATQVFVLPLILYMSGMLSLFALPANILVLPMVPIVMVVGAFTGVLAIISQILAAPFAVISYVLLGYIFLVTKLFASIPFSSFVLPAFSVWLLVLVYAGILFFVFRKS